MNRLFATKFALSLSLLLGAGTAALAQPVADGEGDVAIGALEVDPSALLDLVSTSKGFLLPRMTEAQRDAIVSPAEALQIFNTTTGEFNYWDANTGQWEVFLTSANISDVAWLLDGNDITTDGAWNGVTGNFLGTTSAHDLVLATLQAQEIEFWTANTARARFTAAGNFEPATDNTYSLGTDATRWANAYVNGGSVHIGPGGGEAAGTEMDLGYAANTGTINVDGGINEIEVTTAVTDVNTHLSVTNGVGIAGPFSDGVYIGADAIGNESIELVGIGNTPYIDWSTTGADFDARLILAGPDELQLDGANLNINGNNVDNVNDLDVDGTSNLNGPVNLGDAAADPITLNGTLTGAGAGHSLGTLGTDATVLTVNGDDNNVGAYELQVNGDMQVTGLLSLPGLGTNAVIYTDAAGNLASEGAEFGYDELTNALVIGDGVTNSTLDLNGNQTIDEIDAGEALMINESNGGDGVIINESGAGNALTITEANGGDGVNVTVMDGGQGLVIDQQGLTDGARIRITNPASTADALALRTDGTGRALFVNDGLAEFDDDVLIDGVLTATNNGNSIGDGTAVTQLTINGVVDATGLETLPNPVFDLAVNGDIGASGIIKSGAGVWLDGVSAPHSVTADQPLEIQTLGANDLMLATNNTDAVIIDGATQDVNILNNLDVDGGGNVDGTMNVVGATTLQSTLEVNGATDLNSTLNVDGAADFNSTVNIDGATTINNSLTQNGGAQVTFSGNVDAQNGLDVSGDNLNVDPTVSIEATGANHTMGTLGTDAQVLEILGDNFNVGSYELMVDGDVQITGELALPGLGTNAVLYTDAAGNMSTEGAQFGYDELTNALVIGDGVTNSTLDLNGNQTIDEIDAGEALMINESNGGDGVIINESGAGNALTITEANGGDGVNVTVMDGGQGLVIDQQGLTDGARIRITNPASTADALALRTDGTGRALFVNDGLAEFDDDVQVDGNLTSNDGDVDVAANVVPTADNTFTLGTDANRWAEVYVNGASVHVGPSGGEGAGTELELGYVAGTASVNVDGGSTEIDVTTALTDVNTHFSVTNGVGLAGPFPDGVHMGADALGTEGIEIVALGSSPYLDFSRTGADFDGRIILAGNDELQVQGAGINMMTNAVFNIGDLEAFGNSFLNGNVDLGDAAADAITLDGTLTGAGAGHSLGTLATDATVLTINGDDNNVGAYELQVNGDAQITGALSLASLAPNAVVVTDAAGNMVSDPQLGYNTVTNALNVQGSIENTIGNLTVNDNLVPAVDNTFSLGTDPLRWSEVYVNGGSVHIGPANGEAGNTEMNLGYAAGAGSINVNAGASEIVVTPATTAVNNILNINAGANVTGGPLNVSTTIGNGPPGGSGLVLNDDVLVQGILQMGTNLINNVGDLVFNTAGSNITNAAGVVTINDDLDVNNTLNVDGATTLNGNVALGDAPADVVIVNGALNVASTATLSAFAGGGDQVLFVDNAGTVTASNAAPAQNALGIFAGSVNVAAPNAGGTEAVADPNVTGTSIITVTRVSAAGPQLSYYVTGVTAGVGFTVQFSGPVTAGDDINYTIINP